MSLVNTLLEGIEPTIHKRLEALAWIVNHSEEASILILTRESLILLLKEEPQNAKLKMLIKKSTSKIKLNN